MANNSSPEQVSGEFVDKFDINVMIVAETQEQRMAFSDTVKDIGFNVVGCLPKGFLDKKKIKCKIDLWLVDSQYDVELNDFIAQYKTPSNAMLVGFNQAPFINEMQRYAKWQRQLRRKISAILDLPEIVQHKKYVDKDKQWCYVVFLGASMGGPDALKVFLDNLSPNLPICLLLAHHFNPHMIHTLPRVLTRHNQWRCQVITTTRRLQTGVCLVAPVKNKIVCDSKGRVILLEEGWNTAYKPSISDIFKNTSDVYADDLIGIIFSGMGSDGSQYLQEMQINNSQIWAQEPSDCTSTSQPQAVIDSGLCQYVGSAEQLAKKLTELVTEKVKENETNI